MFRGLSLLLHVSLLVGVATAQDPAPERVMRIGIFRDRPTKQVLVMSAKQTAVILADGERKGELKTTDGLRIELSGKKLLAKSLTSTFSADRIELVPSRADGGFRLKATDRKEGEREYPGRLEVTQSGGRLMLVNRLSLEAYTAGVVSAEAGRDRPIEYYKLQSVSCRTYALTNQRKHIGDGFELCDGVHCQVFHGRNRNESIRSAVEETRNLVIVDPSIKLIHATFHSNCGGETMNAEDLWGKHEPYLRATRDTFCLAAAHATWTKTLSRSEWLGYLHRRFGFNAADTAQLRSVLRYEPQCRDQYLGNTWPLLPLKHVREDLGLKSTFFSVKAEGDRVVLTGRGFGHAVGLCQEGAMGMADAGFNYSDILHHYYRGVHLVDLGTLDFFRDELDSTGTSGHGAAGPTIR